MGRSIRSRLTLLAAVLFSPLTGAGQPLGGHDGDYDALLAMIGDARIVLLGEATHGSREFYRERARISRRLIEEKGFGAVIFEASWEPVRRLDDYVRGEGRDGDAAAALAGFVRFPRWMWRNTEVRDFAESLRARNAARRPAAPVRLYGMDLYSLPESADAVVRQVARRSVEAARTARQRYGCFDQYRPEPQFYGRDVHAGRAPGCAEGAAAQLAEMAAEAGGDDDAFAAWQSARVVSGAEDYYRVLYRGGMDHWNVRERHMADTIDQLLARLGPAGKVVVWAQNVHQGDARETDQAAAGQLSLGQLMRERHGEAAVLVGFTTDRGRVRAAPAWGGRDRIWRLRPALKESWSGQLHRLGQPACLLVFRGDPDLAGRYAERRPERAVGVTYEPHDERNSHYFGMRLSRQFDAVVHIDVTTPLEPLPAR